MQQASSPHEILNRYINCVGCGKQNQHMVDTANKFVNMYGILVVKKKCNAVMFQKYRTVVQRLTLCGLCIINSCGNSWMYYLNWT